MKKRLMAVLLCVCMAAVLLTPYASVLTADGALRLGIAGAENGQDLTGESSSTPTEGGEEAESAETLKEEAPEATATAEPEATATTAPEATATTAPEATKAPAPKYTLDSNRAVYKDGATLRGEPKDCVVKASYSVAQAYKGPTDRSEAKTYKAGDRVRVYDEIQYEDCDGAERKWSVVLDGSDFYFVLSEALESAPELPAQAPAQTDMKSLFGIGDNVDPASINPGDTKVATYNFYNGADLVDSQKIKDGESLKEPKAPDTVDGQKFDGWYTAAEGGEEFTNFGTALTVTETTTTPINLYARFRTVYHVNFYTPNGGTQKFTREVSDHKEHDFSDLSYDVGSDIKATGWAADKNGTVDISKTIKVPEGQTSVSVYAIETKGYWVVFDTQGGTSVAPEFRAAGETLNLNTIVSTRTGYEFKGWRDSAGNAVSTVNSKTTLYATWEPKTANLTVVFWYENADDQYYGQAGTVQTTENTGATVTSDQYKDTPFDGRDNTHFTYNPAKAEEVTVKGDGSTVLNVYYTRNTYTLTFKKGKLTCGKVEHTHSHDQCCAKRGFHIYCNTKKCPNGGKEHTHGDSCYSDLTITAKYNAEISGEFNKAPFNTTFKGRAWECTEPSKYSKPLQTLDRMPGFDATFKLYQKSSDEEKTIYYYVQKIGTTVDSNKWPSSAENFDLLKQVNTYFNWATYDEEYHEILGFTRYSASVAGFDKDNRKDFSNNKLDLYYMRNNYKLRFYNHNGELTGEAKDVPYEAPLKIYADAVTAPYPFAEPGLYTFDGWYTNRLFEQRVDEVENDVKMPASELTLYAKWVPKTFTVSFNLGYANAPAAPADQTVAAKNKATQPADPAREGWRFVGWYDGDKPFSFETEIVKDTALTAKWLQEGSVITVQYNVNGGGGTAPTDTTPYADGAGAVVKDKGDMTAPEGKEFFLGWATTSTATTAEYQPGGTMTIVAEMANEYRVITLYAVWGDKPATTTLTYNANYDGANPMTKAHALEDGTTNLPNNAEVTLYGENTFTRDGYELIGWNTDQTAANAGTVEYACGAKVIVDTDITAGANILYAVWQQSTTTVTVTKQVTGNFADKTKTFAFQYKKAGEETWTVASSLSDGGSFTIDNVTPGSMLLIREMPEGYTASVGSTETSDGHLTGNLTDDGYYTATIAGVVANETITFTNTKNEIPDTGVILDSLPYVLILAVVALGAAGVVIRRRRSREDD